MSNNPKGAGRKLGSTKGRAVLNTTIDDENMEWLRLMKQRGKAFSATLDAMIAKARAEG